MIQQRTTRARSAAIARTRAATAVYHSGFAHFAATMTMHTAIRLLLFPTAAILIAMAAAVHAQDFVQPAAAPVAAPPDANPVAVDTPAIGPNQYFSFLPGYMLADKERGGTRHGLTFSAIYGYQFAPHFSVEVNAQGSIIETGRNRGTDYYQEGGTFDLVYSVFDRRVSWTPYALLGVGGVYDDVFPDSGDKAALVANAGLGVVSGPLFDGGFKLRMEARYNHDFYNQLSGRGFNDYRALAGIEIPFGHREPQVRYIEQPVRVVEVVREVARPWVDSDGDGVDDAHDKCPNTPRGLKVDADGCVIAGQQIALNGVTFEFNKSRLTANAQTILDQLAPAFIGQPGLKVEIAGHTDSVGSAAVNQKLSQQRAEAVREYLIGKGAPSSQLIAVGYGKSHPLISPEKTPEDRELNRRVEFRVLER